MTDMQIGAALHADLRGLSPLLSALCAMRLIEKKGDAYQSSEAGRKFLSKSSPDYIGAMILHHHHLSSSWAALPEAIRTGKPVRTRAAFSEEQWREAFLMGMFTLARQVAPKAVEFMHLEDRRRFLDLGGGPGTYAIHACMRNPELRAVIFDLPTSRPFAEMTIRRYGLEDRISFSPGNYLTGNIKGHYDVVWLSQILHAEGPQDCEALIAKAVAALEPGGRILVHEFFMDDTMDGPLFPAIFALNMLLGTQAGRSYSEGQVRTMLEMAGIVNIEREPFQGPNQSGIVSGVKPMITG